MTDPPYQAPRPPIFMHEPGETCHDPAHHRDVLHGWNYNYVKGDHMAPEVLPETGKKLPTFIKLERAYGPYEPKWLATTPIPGNEDHPSGYGGIGDTPLDAALDLADTLRRYLAYAVEQNGGHEIVDREKP